ncbi:MAG: hypothetical protein WCZ47_02835 [Bacilli bacterium]|nr:hypothetical protein [Bacilli bacterium]NLN79807.1 hypothetical protein [Erysipelotrichia bacterium]
MISDVFLTGRITKVLNKTTRYVEVERLVPDQGKYVVDNIPVSFWNKEPNSFFMKLNEGTLIVLRGRIQNEEQFGIIVIAEQLAVLGEKSLQPQGG